MLSAANWSHAAAVIPVKCLAHARRQFTDSEEAFPEECGHVWEEFATVYRYEAETTGMTPEQRLAHHQLHSAPVLERLQNWISTQFAQRRVEPNSIGLPAAPLGRLNPVSPVRKRTPGYQCRRAGAEAGGVASEERFILPHRTGRGSGRSADECDRDLPGQRHSGG
jgi:Transposase IS66 family